MKKSQMSKEELELMEYLMRMLKLFHSIVMHCPEPGDPKDPNAEKWLAIIRDFKKGWQEEAAAPGRHETRLELAFRRVAESREQ